MDVPQLLESHYHALFWPFALFLHKRDNDSTYTFYLPIGTNVSIIDGAILPLIIF
jgi:hypothetical protein